MNAIDSPIIVLSIPGPRAPMTAIAMRRPGKAMIASMMRMKIVSTQRPKYPLTRPISVPPTSANTTASRAAKIEVRVANITRLSVSKPAWSVPKDVQDGPLRNDDVDSSTLYGAIHGASRPAITMINATMSPRTAVFAGRTGEAPAANRSCRGGLTAGLRSP